MTEHVIEQLSVWLDGELPPAEAAAVDAHLAVCASCRETADELRQVVRAAQSLPDVPPERDLWPGILARIREEPATVLPLERARRRRTFSLSMLQLAAAAAIVALASGSAVWLALRERAPAPVTATAEPEPVVPRPPSTQLIADVVGNYDPTIRALEQELEARQDQLDPSTIATVENSLRVIDAAIEDARAALQTDPSNAFLYQRLDATLMRKIDLLRRATTLRRAST